MSGDSSVGTDATPYEVVDTLDDADCRTILQALNYPMTVSELADRCDIPRPVLFRKINRMLDVSLVCKEAHFERNENLEVEYKTNFDEVTFELDTDRELRIDID